MKIVNKVIWCDAGYFPFSYGFCPNEKAWNREMPKIGMRTLAYPPLRKPGAAFTTGIEDSRGDLKVIVTIQDDIHKRHTRETIRGLIVHEATHVWQELCGKIGEDSPSDEFEAYTIQHISKELLDAFLSSRRFA